MQHDHVLKKLNFDLLTPVRVGLGEGLRVKELLPCCCIHDSISFEMQHDDVLKKLILLNILLTVPRRFFFCGFFMFLFCLVFATSL